MKTTVGSMRQLVTVERILEEPQDSFGEKQTAWTTFAQVWARIIPTDGAEYFRAQQIEATVMHKVFTRYYSGITAQMRLSWDGRILQIVAVEPDETNARQMVLKCYEAA